MWFQFLQDEAFDYLQITSPLDLTKIIPQNRHKHAHHPKAEPSFRSTPDSHALHTSSNLDAGVYPPSLNDSEHSVQNLSSSLDLEGLDPRAAQDIVSVSQLLRTLIKYDKDKQQDVFQSSSVLCNICFSSKLGRYCMCFRDCDHAFCRDCIREYFRIQIQDGNVKELKCPDSKCESQAYPDQVF